MCGVANRHVVKLAGPLQLLQSWIFWRFPEFRRAGYDEFSWPLASRYHSWTFLFRVKLLNSMSFYNREGTLSADVEAQDRHVIEARDFIWMPYSSPDVLQVVHPVVLEPRHTALWRCVTALIYFAVVEWHQIDRVLPQFGGVQPWPQPALNIDFLMSKDGRGGARWFPYALQFWHIHWENRVDHVLRFDVVADPRPSHDFLDWWSQHGKRFLSLEMYLGDSRLVFIPVEATQRGAGRVPDMDRVDDVPDRRRLDQALEEGDTAGRGRVGRQGRGGRRRARAAGHNHGDDGDGGHAGVGGVSPHHAGHGGELFGSRMGDGSGQGDGGLGSGPLGD
ncbi:hypothetical protein Ahy_A07g036524 [Arachis hypogaea]|uniref:Aminotransferase-like plant mobile domain-containing protein n=1 Tax=Arachis hypogaea TaxID=3818 RepID=A0A445CGE6_ARAHY|nr:hypothetical protein Ahy_A07g036524 [Arachis hypogaea]